MAGKVLNIKVCIPLKLRSGLTVNYHAICHYSYNLPLCVIEKRKSLYILTDMRIIIVSIFLFCFNLSYSQFILGSHIRYNINIEWIKTLNTFNNIKGEVTEILDTEMEPSNCEFYEQKEQYVYKLTNNKISEQYKIADNKPSETIKHEYNSKGYLIKSIYSDGFKYLPSYKYDSLNRIIEVRDEAKDGSICIDNQMKYDSLNNLIEFHRYHISTIFNKVFYSLVEFKYDNLNNIIQIRIKDFSRGNEDIYQYEYNSYGNMTRRISIYHNEIWYDYKYSYEYDEKNNWIKQYLESSLHTERKITYK